jgi:hypothetical protein
MTPEERLDKIEHLLTGWVEQSKKEHAENREFIRESKREMDHPSTLGYPPLLVSDTQKFDSLGLVRRFAQVFGLPLSL